MTEHTPLNVLVVGDWVVDENWILAKHNSETSSHIGQAHFRSLVDQVDSQILSLCGAGNVVRALHGLSVSELDGNKGIIKPLQIFGLGLWHPKDTKILASLFSNNTVSNQTPLTLSGMVLESDYSNGKKSLCGMPVSQGACTNLDSEKKRLCDDTLDSCYYLRSIYSHNSSPCFGTTRVVRLFKTSAGGVPEQ